MARSEQIQEAIKSLPYLKIETPVIRSQTLSKEDVIFYMALKSFRNRKNGNCFPSMRKVSERARMNIDTAYKAREKLKNIGLITWPEIKGGRKHKCHYTFSLESGSEEEIAKVLRLLEGDELPQTKVGSKKEEGSSPDTAGKAETEPSRADREVKEPSQNGDSGTIPAEGQLGTPDKGIKVPHGKESNPLPLTNRNLNNTVDDIDFSESTNVSSESRGEVNSDLPGGESLQNQSDFSPDDIEKIKESFSELGLNISTKTIIGNNLPLDEVKRQLVYWPYRNQSRMDNPEGYFLAAVRDKYSPPKAFSSKATKKWKKPLGIVEKRQLNRKLGNDKTIDQKRLEKRRKTVVISPEFRAVFLAQLEERSWVGRDGKYIQDNFFIAVDSNSWKLCYSDGQPIGEDIIGENSIDVIENQLS